MTTLLSDRAQRLLPWREMISMRFKATGAVDMQHKVIEAFQAKLQVIDPDVDAPGGYIEGYASVFGNVDLGNDIVKKGAFAKTIKERLKTGAIKLIDSHNVFAGTSAVIGVVIDAKEDDYGLWFRAKLSQCAAAQDIRLKIKEGVLNALSFGYDVIRSSDDSKTGVRTLEELKLYEISVVIWGMNPKASIATVKGVTSFADWAIDPDVAKQWAGADAVTRVRSWVSDKDPAEWTSAEWTKYAKCHLWVGEAKELIGSYKFLVVDVIDGGPKYIFKAAVASLAIVRGGRGAGPGSDWWASRSDIESQIARIYKKFDKPLPEKSVEALTALEIDALEDVPEDQKASISRNLSALNNCMSEMHSALDRALQLKTCLTSPKKAKPEDDDPMMGAHDHCKACQQHMKNAGEHLQKIVDNLGITDDDTAKAASELVAAMSGLAAEMKLNTLITSMQAR